MNALLYESKLFHAFNRVCTALSEACAAWDAAVKNHINPKTDVPDYPFFESLDEVYSKVSNYRDHLLRWARDEKVKPIVVETPNNKPEAEKDKDGLDAISVDLESIAADPEDEETCDACEGLGYLFPHRSDTGHACVEACDTCRKFGLNEADANAAAALAGELLPLNDRYVIVDGLLPGDRWEDAGACAYVVARYDENETAITPLSFFEGTALAKFLAKPKLPQANMHWHELFELRAGYSIVELEHVFVVHHFDNPIAVVNWSSVDAQAAQRWLKTCAVKK